MKYTIEKLILNFEKGKRNKYLFFWGHQKSKNNEITASCFSQWWRAPFLIDGVKYPTAEHWMMSQKAIAFNDNDNYSKIIEAKSPVEAKAIGRQVRNFNDVIWNEKRGEIVIKGNLEKFTQNKELKEFLLNTKERILVEASPVDAIWGIGLTADNEKAQNPKQWRGLNLLGFALMEVRDELRK
ncbi:NADAR family protein [Flavobacterium sp.]|uniref:NADAR family protein n=1 Tax=Flavobacterium sp. TaxID=239 RepID=UPI00286E8F8E|nr:NADAR family protein [Flavobacterium sp.]